MPGAKVEFSLVLGGPFHHLLTGLRLVGPDTLPGLATTAAVVGLAWLVPATLCVIEFLVRTDPAVLGFFSDYTVYTRYIIAIGAMLATERLAHRRLSPVVEQFRYAGLVSGTSADAFDKLVCAADRRTASAPAETACLAVVIVLAVTSAVLDIQISRPDWAEVVVDGSAQSTWSNWWSHWVSKPLFQFLFLRWLWRFAVWFWLLYRISKLDLHLVAFHPDRCGGLGFLSVYPTVFAGFIFALSCLVASQLVLELQFGRVTWHNAQLMMAAWLGLVALLFLAPLVSFAPVLSRLRERSIFTLGRLASEHHRSFEKKWMSGSASEDGLVGSEDTGSAADLEPIAAAPYTLWVIPIKPFTVIQVLVPAALPMIAVVLTQTPLEKLLQQIAGAIL